MNHVALKKPQLYLPDEATPQQLNIPHKKLKGYLQYLDEGFQVALVDLPIASGPYFSSVKSIPEELLTTYKCMVSAAFSKIFSH